SSSVFCRSFGSSFFRWSFGTIRLGDNFLLTRFGLRRGLLGDRLFSRLVRRVGGRLLGGNLFGLGRSFADRLLGWSFGNRLLGRSRCSLGFPRGSLLDALLRLFARPRLLRIV